VLSGEMISRISLAAAVKAAHTRVSFNIKTAWLFTVLFSFERVYIVFTVSFGALILLAG